MMVFMSLFLFYMIGNSIQIFTIFITVGMVIPQARALFNIGETFRPFEDPRIKDQLTLYKLMYAALHILILAAAIYKFACKSELTLAMGLIPVRPIDWLTLVNYVQVIVWAISIATRHISHLLTSHNKPSSKCYGVLGLSLIHICRCRRLLTCRSRWSPYH
eukprot:TRINITY_DN12253_c0_g1_i10.p2 TRINITY_DN12253_c0_g1~~TRINITY_DN12253_c0_g1_i10.p2  ORF type:complete len:161 (+),score=19.92 TRINITY_DN12253_c0_g1_i10:356-838(+)